MSARAHRPASSSARAAARRLLHLLARESGQSLVEALTAFVILLIAGTGLVQILISSTNARGYSFQESRAEEVAQAAIEQIRNLPYQDVGTVDGNPSGTWSASQLADSSQLGFTGFTATVATSIKYVADPVPNSYIQLTNYKQVTVTVSLNSQQLAQDITYIAPPTQTLQGNQSQGSITVNVMDEGDGNTPVSGATIDLGTGPSAPESDTTAATGSVTFAGLTPNPSSGSQSTYTLSPLPTLPTGYEPASGNVTSTVLTAGGASTLDYYVFQPSTIDVDPTVNGAAFVGTLQVTVTPQSGTPETYSVTCTSSGCTPITGNASLGIYIAPGNYTLTATGTSGTTNYITASGVTEAVPSNYPSNLTQTFTLPLLTVPTVTVTAPSTINAGTAITASAIGATLSGAVSPTGTIKWTVFGPQSTAPTTCASGGTAVGSPVTVTTNTTYNPTTGFTPGSIGDYWWYASYSGDSNNSAETSTCGSGMTETVVAKASPSLTLSAPATDPVGTTIADASVDATLSGGSSPTGSITFHVFGPQASAPTTCTSGTFGSTVTVSGDAVYSPSGTGTPLTPTTPGNYWWYASYGGDSNDNGAATTCGTGMAETVVGKTTPTLSVSPPAGATAGATVASSAISASLSGAYSATGAVTFVVFGPQASAPTTCTSGGTTVGSDSSSPYNPSGTWQPTVAGDYWWYATFAGDSDNSATTATCGALMPETVVAMASPTISVSAPASGTLGSAIAATSITAALSGGSSPTGSVTFTVFGPQSSAPTTCTSGGNALGTDSSSPYNSPTSFTPSSAGDYWWYASYSGDTSNNGATSTCGSGMTETVVPKVATTLTATGPASGTIGTAIATTSISSTLGGGSGPTGTVTWTVFGPQATAPTTCTTGGTAVGTGTTVSGTGAYYPTAGFTPSAAGDYWWYASYSGDGNHSASSSTCGSGMSETVVPKVATTLTPVSGPATGTASTPISFSAISATLNGGSSPTGTISFTVFGPQTTAPTTCTSGGTAVGSGTTVSGTGAYNPTVGYNPPSAGDYWWYASYGGDSNNSASTSTCGSGMSETVVGKASPALTAAGPGSGNVGTAITAASISGTLSGAAAATGTVSFKVFGPQASAPTTCTSGGTAVGTGTTVSGNATYNPSAAYTPTSAGDYWWYASYGGDSNNNTATSTCGSGMSETVVATAVTSLTASGPASGTIGTAIATTSISAVLSGGTGATGTVTFTVFGPQASAPTTCTSGGTAVGTGTTVSGNTTYHPSAGYTPTTAGNYWWYASYGGDSNNAAAASTCGSGMAETTVPKYTTTLTAAGPASGTIGTAIATTSISGVLSGGTGATGTVSFTVFGPQATAPTTCTSGGTAVGSGTTVSGNATYHPSAGYTPTTAGNYWWYASYSGDSNNAAAASTCGSGMAETTVPKYTTTLTATAPASDTVGTAIATTSITSALSGGTSPTGTVSFTVFGPQATAPTTCTSGGTAVGTGTTVSGNGSYHPTASFSPPTGGDYWWYASYGGDTNNAAAASTCGSGMAETVVAMTATSLGTGTQTGGTTVSTSSSINTTGYPTGTTALILVSLEASSGKTCSSASNVGSGTALTGFTSAIGSTSYKTGGGATYQMCAFWAQTNNGTGSVQVTFSASVSEASIQVVEITGDNTSSPIGKTGTGSGTSSAPAFTVASGITSGSSEILFGADENSSATPPTWSTPSGFTQVGTLTLSNGTTTENLAVYLGPTATSVTGALSASATWGTFGIELLP